MQIILARTTGRRLGSILGLRWDDLDFESELILWRAELDKKRKTWNVPMPRSAKDPLLAHRARFPAIGNALLFPHPKANKRGRGESVTRHLAAYWLKQAYARANVLKPDGGLWHVFRRLWATERKHLPPMDVATAGGWSDIGTLVGIYQQPDQETLREVINLARARKSTRFPPVRRIQPHALSRAQHTR